MRSLRYDRKLSTAYVQAYLNISRTCPPAHVTSVGEAIKYHPCAPGAAIVIAQALYEVGPGLGVEGTGRGQAARLLDRFVFCGHGEDSSV
jgi:hypothetical protein